MDSQSRTQIVAAAAAVGVLMTLAIAVAQVRDARYPRPAASRESLSLTSGPAVRRLSLGYGALAADLYWIRAIQYYGALRLRNEGVDPGQAGERERGSHYQLLYPLLDLTTTLDPRFNIAYRFGAIFLAEPPPGGAGRADLAIQLLEKGLRELPDKWDYMMDIGFVHYWWTRDYRTAADWFERASLVPGAPSWLRALAATTVASGGDRRTSRLMWEQIRQSAEVDWLRRQATWRLMQLQALDDIDALQRLLDRERENGGTPSSEWRALVQVGRLRGIPADPTGVPYEIGAGGRVRLGAASTLRPLPEEPQRPAIPRS